MEPTDAALFDRWSRAGNADAFAELVARHAGMVYATALRILRNAADAEDVTQDAFIRLSQLNRATQTSLAGWLHRVAANRAIDVLRSRQSETVRTESLVHAAFTSTDPAWAEVEAILDEEVAALPDDLRLPIVLHFFEGKTHAAVAAELNMSRPTVTRRIHEATGALRDRIAKRGVTLTGAILAANLATLRVHAAPAGLITRLGKRLLASDLLPKTEAGVAWGTGPWRLAAFAFVSAAAAVVTIGLLVQPLTPSATPETSAAAYTPDVIAAPVPEPIHVAQAPASSSETPTVDSAVAFEAPFVRCVDRQGNPVAGAEVYVLTGKGPAGLSSSREADGPLTTDADGRVALPLHDLRYGVDPGSWSVYARVPGKLAGCYGRLVHEEPRSLDLVMKPSLQVTGLVTVPEGFDLRDVAIEVLHFRYSASGPGDLQMYSPSLRLREASGAAAVSAFPPFFAAVPDRRGGFVVADVPSDAAFYLTSYAKGLAETQFHTLDSTNIEKVDLTMTPEAAISGFVRRASGNRPVGRARVSAKCLNSGGVQLAYTAETGPDGSFYIDGLPSGLYDVTVGNVTGGVVAPIAQLPVETGMVSTGADLYVEDGVLVTGRVVAEDTGEPVADVSVEAIRPMPLLSSPGVGSVRTDADGRYAIRVPAGVTKFYVAGYPEVFTNPGPQGEIEIDAASSQRELTLQDIALPRRDEALHQALNTKVMVQGRVLDSGGEPIEGALVYDIHEVGGMHMPFKAADTGADGTYSFEAVLAGKHRLYAGKIGYTKAVGDWVTLSKDRHYTMPDLVISRAPHWLEGVVVDAEGRPVPNARVWVGSPNAFVEDAGYRSDADGYFRVEGLPNEEIGVSAEWGEYEGGATCLPDTACRIVLKPKIPLQP